MVMRFLAVAILVGLTTAPARGDARSDEAQAKAHFTNGRALYDTGNYEEAMREFALGFELVDNPVFLLNIGFCHYRLGHLVQARDNFQRFLRVIPADHPSRVKGQEALTQVEHDLAQQPPPTEAVPPSSPSPSTIAPPSTSVSPSSVSPSSVSPSSPPALATAMTTTTTKPRKSWMRRVGWVIPVVVVAAAGVAVGLGLGLTRNNVCNNASVCVPITQ